MSSAICFNLDQSKILLSVNELTKNYILQELARRFSLSFGLDQVKNREAVAAMHRYKWDSVF